MLWRTGGRRAAGSSPQPARSGLPGGLRGALALPHCTGTGERARGAQNGAALPRLENTYAHRSRSILMTTFAYSPFTICSRSHSHWHAIHHCHFHSLTQCHSLTQGTAPIALISHCSTRAVAHVVAHDVQRSSTHMCGAATRHVSRASLYATTAFICHILRIHTAHADADSSALGAVLYASSRGDNDARWTAPVVALTVSRASNHVSGCVCASHEPPP